MYNVGTTLQPSGQRLARQAVIIDCTCSFKVVITVVVDGQRAVGLGKDGIGSVLVAQVARIVNSAIHFGIGLIMRIGAFISGTPTTLQVLAVVEHGTRTRHVVGVPTLAYIDGHQIRAAAEHIAHVGHLAGVERSQVEQVERRAVGEHQVHGGHHVGVQVLKSGDVGHFVHIVEPAIGGRRTGDVERRVEHHMHRILRQPFGNCRIETERLFMSRTPAVVVEGQRLCILIPSDIRRCHQVGEVAWRAAAAVDVGIGLVGRIAAFVSGALFALQSGADGKHVNGIGHVVGVPAIAHGDRLQ